MLSQIRREQRIEANWKIFRISSMIATGVLLVLLLAVDVSFEFASWQFNTIIILVAVCMIVLFKLDFWIHQLTRSMRARHKM